MNFGICFKQRLGIWNRLGFMSQVNWLKSLPLDGVLTWSFLGNKMKSPRFNLVTGVISIMLFLVLVDCTILIYGMYQGN